MGAPLTRCMCVHLCLCFSSVSVRTLYPILTFVSQCTKSPAGPNKKVASREWHVGTSSDKPVAMSQKRGHEHRQQVRWLPPD
jgi:hypothetical protein